MSNVLVSLPPVSWRQPVATASLLPVDGNQVGDAIVTQDTEVIYLWNGSSWTPVTAGGGAPGTVTSVGLTDGILFSVSGSPVTTSGTLALSLLNQNTNTVFAGPSSGPAATPTFRPLVSADIPDSVALTGVPTAPTAAVSTSTTQLATTAFVQSQGFVTSTGTIPTGEQDNATVVTSATTTFVNALTTTVTLTATAPIFAVANSTLTTTGSACVAGLRVTINAVASRTALLTLSAVTTNYMGTVQFLSASLAPGTYTVNFDIQRSSGTGTVNYQSGTLVAEGLQGTTSNGITTLTGDVTAGPGSGSQASTIAAAAVTLAKMANLASTNIIVGNASNRPTAVAVSGDATLSNTGALTVANLAITNAKIANTTINLTTKVTGTLPFGNGGTGSTSIASGRVPFSNGTALITDPQFLYDTTNVRLTIGTGGGTGTLNVVPVTSSLGLNVFSQTGNHSIQIQNQAAEAIEMINASAGGTANGVHTRASQSRGTLTARTQSLSGDNVWDFSTLGYTGSTFGTNSSAGMSVVLTENYTATNQGADMVFFTATNGTSSGAVERVRVKNSGETAFTGAIATARMSTATKNALTPAGGWVVFDTTLNQLSYYNGTSWVNL